MLIKITGKHFSIIGMVLTSILIIGIFSSLFIGMILYLIETGEENQKINKDLNNKYQYLIGKKINTGSDTTIVIKICISADHKVYGETYDNKTIPIEAIEKNVIK